MITREEIQKQAWIGDQRSHVVELVDMVDFLKAQVAELLKTRDNALFLSVDEIEILRAELKDLRDWPCEFCPNTLGNISDFECEEETHQHAGIWVCGNCYHKALRQFTAFYRSALLSADGSHLHADSCSQKEAKIEVDHCPECNADMIRMREVNNALRTSQELI